MAKIPIIDYTCRNCGGKFPAQQGSRKQLCPACLVKAVYHEEPTPRTDSPEGTDATTKTDR